MRHRRSHRAAAGLGGALTLLMASLIAAGPVGATQPSRFLSVGTGFTETLSGSCPFTRRPVARGHPGCRP